MITWLNKWKYNKIVLIIGRFHTLLFYQKILYKKYGCLSFQDWWVDAGTIAEGSFTQVIQGKHYARGIQLHKQSFCALIRWRLKSITPNKESLKRCIANLRVETNEENLSKLFKLELYEVFCQDLLKVGDRIQARMVVEYLKNVSKMLALIFSMREKSIELHLAVERVKSTSQSLKSGVQIEESIVDGLLKSQTIGKWRLKEFIEDGIKAPGKTKINLFNTIPRENIATGLKKEKQEKKIDVLKEDRQVFGLLVGKFKTLGEALAHPLTTIPLALAKPDSSL